MRHLNIAFFSDTYLPAVDGVVTSMLDFKRELEKRGHRVYIFASCNRKDKKRYEGRDVFLYTGMKFRPYPQYSVALFPYSSSLKLRKLKIDIIHVQTPFTMGMTGMLAAKVLGYPLVGTFHTMVNDKSLATYYPKNRVLKRFYAKYVWKYIKFFYKSCNITIAPSETVADMLREHRISRVSVVPNGIDISKFNPRANGSAVRREFGIGGREKVILYVGRVSKEKKLHVLLKAMKVLARKRKDVLLLVIGGGPALEEHRRMARRLGLSNITKFLGMINHDALPRYYAAANVLCLPSSTFETQGIVSLEAMATGTPVVGANTPVLRELIKKGRNGELFRDGDSAACAKNLEKVLNNYGSYTRNATNAAKNYTTERVTDKIVKIYEHLASNR